MRGDPLILTIDAGSSSVRASIHDRRGRAVSGLEARRPYQFATTSDGGVEVGADALFKLVVETIEEVLARCGPRSSGIAAVAMSTFWHNLVGVDGEGRALTPVYSWADTRSAAAAEELRGLVDESRYHARTGCPLHPSYLPAKLLWLYRSRPEWLRGAPRWMSFGEYAYLKLFGVNRCSLSMASGTGLLDQERLEWDEGILQVLPLEPNQLSPLVDLDTPLSGLGQPFAGRWPELSRIPWISAVGDGACSNVGSGCCTPDRLALMVGTSGAMRVMGKTEKPPVPQGLWCYRANRNRFVMGGSLSNGGLLFEWMTETLRLERDRKAVESRLSELAPDSHGLTLLPFLAGERSPGWQSKARAAMTGLSLHTRPIEILRASLESVAYRFAKIASLLESVVPEEREIVASGGALLRSPVWLQIMADVLGQSVVASAVKEASSRGAALLALEALGVLDSIEQVETPLGPRFHPCQERHERYRRALERHDRLYRLLLT
ncbi:MAG: gluconokinase [Acidobacteria bacterium]|nr:gluconokinase [Acidobacteriota bacterium]